MHNTADGTIPFSRMKGRVTKVVTLLWHGNHLHRHEHYQTYRGLSSFRLRTWGRPNEQPRQGITCFSASLVMSTALKSDIPKSLF